MFTIGITGGIGAGKTTAADFFLNKSAYIFNADKKSKSYLKHTVSVQHKLINATRGNTHATGLKLHAAFVLLMKGLAATVPIVVLGQGVPGALVHFGSRLMFRTRIL